MTTTIDTTILTIDPRDLVLLKQNARYMTKDQFLRLTENIRKDGVLTSTPLCAPLPDGRLEVLSGNHRTKAAIAAGLDEIDVMRIDSPLTEDQRRAIQLSHNAIAGEDDPHKLRELFDSIADLDEREYSGLDDAGLDMLIDDTQIPPIASTALEYRTLSIMLLPEQLDRARVALDQAREAILGDEVWVGRFAAFDAMLDSLDVAARLNGGRNQAIALETVLGAFQAHVADYADRAVSFARNDQPAPLPAILGWDLPPDAARITRDAVDRMLKRQEITEPWQAVETWAAEYLSDEKPGDQG